MLITDRCVAYIIYRISSYNTCKKSIKKLHIHFPTANPEPSKARVGYRVTAAAAHVAAFLHHFFCLVDVLCMLRPEKIVEVAGYTASLPLG